MSEYHIPALLEETIEGLAVKANGVYVDVTYGGGGHSRAILELLREGRLIGFDQDKDALENGIEDDRFLLVNHNFRFIRNFLSYYEIDKVDGILADLGVSSHHFNKAERGFSFRFEGPLDMRMNTESGQTAEDIINEYDKKQLLKVFQVYGEIDRAGRMVQLIMNAREAKHISSIQQFLEVIEPCTPKKNESKFLAKVFQGLRIEVNHEIDVLIDLLNNSVRILKEGGRFAIITYHSLEDRLVKNFFRSGNIEGKLDKDVFGNANVPFRVVNRKVIIPGDDEIRNNNRIRSAKLRIAERI
jgi:16S rRNA (cytosine1402-N4)-methyltransferase